MARETQFRTEAMTSRIAQPAIIDAVIACLSLADYDKALATIGKTFDVLSTKRYEVSRNGTHRHCEHPGLAFGKPEYRLREAIQGA
jgi:hypothetical protein